MKINVCYLLKRNHCFSFVLLDRRVFFFLLHQMKEKRGQRWRKRWSSSCHARVWMVWYISCHDEQLRYIRCRDRVSPPRLTGRGPTPTGSGTCPRQLWVAGVIPQPSSHVLQALVCSDVGASYLGTPMWQAIEEKMRCFRRGSADGTLSLPKPNLFSEHKDVVWYHHCLRGSVLIEHRCLACVAGDHLEHGALSLLWSASWGSLLKCAEDGGLALASLEACSR